MFIEEIKNLSYPWTDFILFFLYIISITQGLISNLLIFITLIRTHKTKSATYILMSNMAIADLLSALFILAQWYFCSDKFFFHENHFLSNETFLNDTSLNDTSLKSFNNISVNNNINNSINFTSLNYTSLDFTSLNYPSFNYPSLNNISLNNSLNNTFLNDNSLNDNQYFLKKNSRNQTDKNIEFVSKKNLMKKLKNEKIDQKTKISDNITKNQQVQKNLKTNNLIKKNQLAEKSIQLTKNLQTKNDKAISIFQLNLANKSFYNSKHIIFEPISSDQAFNYIFLNDKNFSLISFTKNNFKKFEVLKDFQYIDGNYQNFLNLINPIDKLKNTSVLVKGNKMKSFLENNSKKQNLNNRTLNNDTNIKSNLNDRSKRLNYLNNQNLNYIRIRKNLNNNHSFFDNFHEKFHFKKNLNKNLSKQESLIDLNDKNLTKINIASKLQNLIKKLTKKKLGMKKIKLINKLPNYQQRICVTLETLQMSSYYVSTLTMAGIAYNRYRLINKPMAPKMDTAMFITIIWFTSLSFSILASLSSLRIFVFFTPERFIDCRIILRTNDDWNLRKIRAIFLMIIQFVIPLSCISFFYIKVIKELKNCGSSSKKLPFTFSTNSFSLDNFQSLKSQNEKKFHKLNEPKNLANKNILIDQNNNLKESNNPEHSCLSNYNKTKRFSLPISSLNEKLNFKSYQKNYQKDLNSNEVINEDCSTLDLKPINQNSSKFTKPTKFKKLSLSLEKFFYTKKNSLNSQLTFNKFNNSNTISRNLSDWELDQTKRRLTKMMITVVLLFTISWIPIHAMHIKQFFIDKYEDNNYCDSSFIYLFFYWMAYSTFIYNPIVYLYFSKELRKDTKDTLSILFKKKKSKVYV